MSVTFDRHYSLLSFFLCVCVCAQLSLTSLSGVQLQFYDGEKLQSALCQHCNGRHLAGKWMAVAALRCWAGLRLQSGIITLPPADR